MISDERNLWQAVLQLAIDEALEGCSTGAGIDSRKLDTLRAREWFTKHNADFNTVVTMAGLDPVAVREHMIHRIADAPSVDDLFTDRGDKRRAQAAAARNAKAAGAPKPVKTLTYQGETLTYQEWSERSGIPLVNLSVRIAKGWSASEALNTPIGPRYKTKRTPNLALTYNGQTRTFGQWAIYTGIPEASLRQRIHKGWSVEKALTTPAQPRQHRRACDTDTKPQNKTLGRKPTMTLTHDGQTLPYSEWVSRTGIPEATLRQRIHKGWTTKRALTTPAQNSKRQAPGVVPDFGPLSGTGGGKSAQDGPEINFSQKAA